MKLRFLKLMLLLFILPLQMLAAELGVAGKQLAALPGRAISNRGWCSAIEDSTVLPCS